jgi:hemerythrin-like domain-containing protein
MNCVATPIKISLGRVYNYEVVLAVIAYFQVYPDAYHHPQEDMVFEKLKARDPASAAKIGDLTAEHRKGAKRLSQVAQAVENGLMDQGVSRHTVDDIIRDFIVRERHHMAMEEREFFPAAALQPQDWAEIASSRLTGQKDPLFSEICQRRSNFRPPGRRDFRPPLLTLKA